MVSGKLLHAPLVDAILKFNRPTDRKHLKSFLGIAGYYRNFIPHFAQTVACLTNLLRKNTRFVWTDKEDIEFLDLKSRLSSRPILRPPDFSIPFSTGVDAFDVVIGENLFQVVDNVEHPVCYYSKHSPAAIIHCREGGVGFIISHPKFQCILRCSYCHGVHRPQSSPVFGNLWGISIRNCCVGLLNCNSII